MMGFRLLMVLALLAWQASRVTWALEVYRAIPPYSPNVAGVPYAVDLAGKARSFDFGGSAPFLNAVTGVADFATINVWSQEFNQAQVLSGSKIPANGVPGRVFKKDGYTAIGYLKGDGIVEGKLRTQLNSFPISARKYYVWELIFRLGGASLFSPWVFTNRGVAPATLWQLKAEGLPPALVLAVDTDPNNAERVSINFDARLDPLKPAVRLADVSGINPSIDTDIRIEAFLDERPALQGSGYLRVWVNGILIIDRWGPVLQDQAQFPYHWSLAMYLYNNTQPLTMDRFVYWKKARMLVDN